MPSTVPPNKYTGCLPRETTCGVDGAFPVWGTDGDCPVFSRDDLREFVRSDSSLIVPNYHWHTVDQARQNSCTASDFCNIMMVVREMEGKDRVVFSQASLYAYDGITLYENGTYKLHERLSDRGMNLEVAMLIAMVHGVAPRFRPDGSSYVHQYDWRQRDWPDDVDEVCAQYRLGEAWDVPEYWAMLSAVKMGYPVPRGLRGHCVGQVHPRLVLGTWEDYNEDDDHGLHEWGTTEREVNRGIDQYGAWAFRCTAAEDNPRVGRRVPDDVNVVPDNRRRRWWR